MTRHLLPGPSLAGQLEDVLGDQLVSSIRLSTLRPLSSSHRRVGFKSCAVLLISCVHSHIKTVSLTLLEGIFQLIRPNRLPILTGVTSRTCPIFQVLLGLQVASTPSGSYIGSNRMKTSQLACMKPSSHGLLVHARRWDMVRDRLGILVSQLLEMFFTSGIVCQGIRIGLDIARGILQSPIRMSTDSVEGRLALRHEALGLPVSSHGDQRPASGFSKRMTDSNDSTRREVEKHRRMLTAWQRTQHRHKRIPKNAENGRECQCLGKRM